MFILGIFIGYFLGKFLNKPARNRGAGYRGEQLVSKALHDICHHLWEVVIDDITLKMPDGSTTQIDHILLCQFGVFVIETKDYRGNIFGSADQKKWTQTLFSCNFTFQNPLRQNFRHVKAVQDILDFLPAEHIKSLVVFTDDSQFKTLMPENVIHLNELRSYLLKQNEEPKLSLNRIHFCLGRIVFYRMAPTDETDKHHLSNLASRHRKHNDK